ncbi:MAG: hypothetical protein RIC89_04225 [Pseudomonadales bacterium]
MRIQHKTTAEKAGKSAHRDGGISFHYLLTGEDNAKDNFVLALVETTDEYSTPRHHHNFEQVRLMLDGDFEYEPGHVQRQGSVGYFSEGTYYTPKGLGRSVALILQVGGATGYGFMSHNKLRKGSAKLAATGKFEDGIYTWFDEQGKKHNADGYAAAWEHVMGAPVVYPKPRYERPVIMFPENFQYLQDADTTGLAVKELGRFNERCLQIRQVRMDAGSDYGVDCSQQSQLFYVLSGSGNVEQQPWQAESAFQGEKGESISIHADEPTELFVIGLPVFDN